MTRLEEVNCNGCSDHCEEAGQEDAKGESKWTELETPQIAIAISNFKCSKDQDESLLGNGLILNIGDLVKITQRCQGWCLGFNLSSSMSGFFPEQFVKEWKFDLSNVADEAVLALYTWRPVWKNLFENDGSSSTLLRVQQLMERIVSLRRQIKISVLTTDQVMDLQRRLADCIDDGNSLLNLGIVARDENGAAVGGSGYRRPVYLFNKFVEADSKIVSLIGRQSKPTATNLLHIHSQTSNTYSLMVKIVNFIYPRLEEDIALFLLIMQKNSNGNMETITEKAHVDVNSKEDPIIVFTDLPEVDNLYILCSVYRLIKYGDDVVMRPFARSLVGSLKCLRLGETRSIQNKFYQCEDKDFAHFPDLYAKNGNNLSKPLWPSARLDLNLKVLRSLENRPVELESFPTARSLGFSSVIAPGILRNDLYLTLESGNFERGVKARSVEVTLRVFDHQNRPISHCIIPASGLQHSLSTTFPVLYHVNTPIWNETVKLSLSLDDFPGAHVRLEFRHCSTKDKMEKKLLGFSHFHLMNPDGTTICDGKHLLCIYKCDDASQFRNPKVYSSLPSRISEVKHAEQVSVLKGFVRNFKERITISTHLCSTKLTQNVYLMSLLNWKSEPDKLSETLDRILLVEGDELVKFLQDIFDALFEMFTTEDGTSTPYSGQVFQVLVHIISTLSEPRFKHFGPVMDTYINDHFSAALVYKGLLTCLRHFTDHAYSDQCEEPMRKCFTALEFVIKLIVRSRLLFLESSLSQKDHNFNECVKLAFDSFNKMLTYSNKSICKTQVVFLRQIARSYPHLLKILPMTDVAEFITLMFGTLCREVPKEVSDAILNALGEIVKTEIFKDVEARNLFLPTCCTLCQKYLEMEEFVEKVSRLIGEILNMISLTRANEKGNEITILVEVLLEPMIDAVLSMEGNKNDVISKGRLVTCILSLFRLMTKEDFKTMWERLNHENELKSFLIQMYSFLQMMLESSKTGTPVIPLQWNNMRMVFLELTMTTIQELSQMLLDFFSSSSTFDKQLWVRNFTLAVTFIDLTEQDLESKSELSRHVVVTQFGDLRLKMSEHLLFLWSQLGDLRQNMTTGIVSPILQMTLIPHTQLRKSTIPIFYDFLDYEFRNKKNFKQVETELVDKLDILVQENKADLEYKELFSGIMIEMLEERDPIWQKDGKAFVESVVTLLSRLLEYREALEGDASSEKQMSCIVSLLDYYKSERSCQELLERYIYKLHDLHLPSENFVEAGFALKMHADKLKWSGRTLHADLRYPSQREWERKEQLYLKIIDLFDRGKCWEHAIPLCKELADLYEHKVFEYKKLSDILVKQAKFCEKIIASDHEALRFSPEFFRVGFFGKGFPLFLRNKEFVYRGSEFEKLSTFTQRILDEFPLAQLLTSITPPDDDIKFSDSQYVQICCVKPILSTSDKDDADNGIVMMPERIRQSRERMSVSEFRLDRPFHKEPRSLDNEFKSLWVERTTLRVKSAFPGILRWFEVVSTNVDLITPIAFACETIENKNREISRLINDDCSGKTLQRLSQNLQGVIDAAVNGGTAKYQEAFFDATFLDKHPEHSDHVQRLQRLMYDQVDILEQALKQHDRLIKPEVKPLHDHLVDRWKSMKESLIQATPPAPTMRRSASKSSRKGPLPPVPYAAHQHDYSSVPPPVPPITNPRRRKSYQSRSSLSSSYWGQTTSDDDSSSLYSQPSSSDFDRMSLSFNTYTSISSPGKSGNEDEQDPPRLPPRLSGSSIFYKSLSRDSPPPIPPKSSLSTPTPQATPESIKTNEI